MSLLKDLRQSISWSVLWSTLIFFAIVFIVSFVTAIVVSNIEKHPGFGPLTGKELPTQLEMMGSIDIYINYLQSVIIFVVILALACYIGYVLSMTIASNFAYKGRFGLSGFWTVFIVNLVVLFILVLIIRANIPTDALTFFMEQVSAVGSVLGRQIIFVLTLAVVSFIVVVPLCILNLFAVIDKKTGKAFSRLFEWRTYWRALPGYLIAFIVFFGLNLSVAAFQTESAMLFAAVIVTISIFLPLAWFMRFLSIREVAHDPTLQQGKNQEHKKKVNV